MWLTGGHPGGPAAVVLPGSGSSADFVGRAFGPPLEAAGYALLTADPPTGGQPLDAAFAALDAAATRRDVRLVGGISLGAHIAVRWAARHRARTGARPLTGLLLALPAWTGAPDGVAAASALTADDIDRYGIDGTLARVRTAGAARWVLEELTAAWPRYGATLAATLRAAAASTGPTPAQLAGLRMPAGVIGLTDDPLHPLAVAEQWATLLPRAALGRLGLAELAGDRSALGTAALAALRQATGASTSASGR